MYMVILVDETPNAQADTQYTDRIKIALDDSGGGVDIDPGVYRSGDPGTQPLGCASHLQ